MEDFQPGEFVPLCDGLLHCSHLAFESTPTLKTRFLDLLSSLSSHKDSNNEGIAAFLRLHMPGLLCVLQQVAYLQLQAPSSSTGLLKLWNGLVWLRPDYIALQLGLGTEFLYAVWAGIGLLTVLVGTALAGTRWKVEGSLRTGLNCIALCPVPLLGILLSNLVASTTDPLAVSTASGLRLISALCLLLLCGLYGIRGLYTAEIVCNSKQWTGVKHCDIVETAADIGEMTVAGLLRYLISPYNSSIFYTLSALLHLSVCLFYILRQPLYSACVCEERASGSLFLGWTSGSLLLGHMLGSDIAAVLLAVLVGTGLIGVLHCHWGQIYTYVLSSSLQQTAKDHTRGSVLLAIRAICLEEQGDEQRLRKLQVLREGHRGLLAVVESSYALQIMKNETLARFQLSAYRKNSYIMEDFFAYRMEKRFQYVQDVPSYLYLLFLLGQIHTLDHFLCLALAKFWLSLPAPSPKPISRLISSLFTHIQAEKKLYRGALLTEPDNPSLLTAFSAFLSEVLMKPNQAVVYENRAKVVRESLLRTEYDSELSLRHPSTGIIIADIDGDEDEIGQIHFSNRAAANFLQYELNRLVSMRVFALLPGQFAINHLHYLRSFALKRESVSISHPGVLPLLTARGYIREFAVKISVTAEKGVAVLVLSFRPANLTREMAVLWGNVIIAHTEGFGMILKGSSSLLSMPVSAFVPSPLQPNKPVLVQKSPPLSLTFNNSEPIQTLILTSGYPQQSNFWVSSSSTLQPIRQESRIPSSLLATPKPSQKTEPLEQICMAGDSWNTTFRPLRNSLRHTYRLLACVLITSALFLLLWSVILTVFLMDITENMLANSISVELAQQVIHTTRVASQGRFLDLTNAGFFPAEMTVDVKNVVGQSVAILTTIEPLIWNRVKTASSPAFQSLYLQNSLFMWELEGLLPHPRPKTLIDAMRDYREQSSLILTLPIANLSIQNPAIYSVVHNGMKGDLALAQLKSLKVFEAMEKGDLENKASQASYFIIAVLLFLAAETLVIALLVGKLHYQVKSLSGLFTGVSRSRLMSNLRRVNERLSLLYHMDMDSSLPPTTPHPQSLYQPIPHLAPWLLAFPIGSGLLYFLIYIVMLQPQGNYLANYPTVLLYNGLSFTGLIDLWTWTMEAIFMDSTWPLKVAIPGPSFQINPVQEIVETDEALRNIYLEIDNLGRKGYLPYSSPHINTLLYATNYSTPIYRKGLRPGFFAYQMDIFLCEGYRGVSTEMYTDCGNLYSAARELVNISSDVLEMLRSDFQSEVQYRVWSAGDWLLGGAGMGIGYVCLWALPILALSQRRVRRLGGLVGLVVGEEEGKTKEGTFGRSVSEV